MLTFLLIEDNDNDAQLVQRALLPLGDSYTLKRVRTLADAKRLLLNPREEIHLILTDLKLPDSEGLNVVKALPEYLPIVILSGVTTPAMQVHALDMGVQVFLDKNKFEWSTLPEIVTRVLYAAKNRKCIVCDVERHLVIVQTSLATMQQQLTIVLQDMRRLTEIETWLFGKRTLDEQVPGAVDIIRDVKNYQKWAKIAFGTAITAIIASLATAIFG